MIQHTNEITRDQRLINLLLSRRFGSSRMCSFTYAQLKGLLNRNKGLTINERAALREECKELIEILKLAAANDRKGIEILINDNRFHPHVIFRGFAAILSQIKKMGRLVAGEQLEMFKEDALNLAQEIERIITPVKHLKDDAISPEHLLRGEYRNGYRDCLANLDELIPLGFAPMWGMIREGLEKKMSQG